MGVSPQMSFCTVLSLDLSSPHQEGRPVLGWELPPVLQISSTEPADCVCSPASLGLLLAMLASIFPVFPLMLDAQCIRVGREVSAWVGLQRRGKVCTGKGVYILHSLSRALRALTALSTRLALLAALFPTAPPAGSAFCRGLAVVAVEVRYLPP